MLARLEYLEYRIRTLSKYTLGKTMAKDSNDRFNQLIVRIKSLADQARGKDNSEVDFENLLNQWREPTQKGKQNAVPNKKKK